MKNLIKSLLLALTFSTSMAFAQALPDEGSGVGNDEPTPPPVSVPEPSLYLLFGTGIAALGFARFMRKRNS